MADLGYFIRVCPTCGEQVPRSTYTTYCLHHDDEPGQRPAHVDVPVVPPVEILLARRQWSAR